MKFQQKPVIQKPLKLSTATGEGPLGRPEMEA
jgi:hypothetical protein